MKKTMMTLLLLLPLLAAAQGTVAFEKYFIDRTMRIDVFHTGDAKQEMFTVDRVILEGPWAGNPLRLDAPFELGRYLLRVSDAASGTLVYSKGFDSYFGEYKTTEPGVNGVQKTFPNPCSFPFPKAGSASRCCCATGRTGPSPSSAASSTPPILSSSAKNRAATFGCWSR